MDLNARVVDISAWVSGGVDRQRTLSAAAIDEALTEATVVQVTGHGIPSSVVDGLTRAMDALFALDDDAKHRLAPPVGHNRGYSAPRTESLAASLGLSLPERDLFEAFTVGASATDYPRARANGISYADSIWPELPDFRRHVDTYFNEAGRVTRTLMNILGDGLGVGRTYFTSLTDHSIDTMRMLRYPAGGTMSPHADYGFTTLALAPEPGLQVALDGAWLDVVAADGTLLVMVGELLSRVTNERWRPTLHRVVATKPRTSALFWHDGNAEAMIGALPGLLASGEEPLDPPVRVGEHITAKLTGSRTGVPYVGAERLAARLPPE